MMECKRKSVGTSEQVQQYWKKVVRSTCTGAGQTVRDTDTSNSVLIHCSVGSKKLLCQLRCVHYFDTFMCGLHG